MEEYEVKCGADCGDAIPAGQEAWRDGEHMIHDDESCAWAWLKTNWSYAEIFEALRIQKVIVGAE